MRTAYLKGGDVVRHFESIASAGGGAVTDGPDLFINEFMKTSDAEHLLLLSRHRRHERYTGKGITAVVFNGDGWLVVKALRRTRIFLEVLRDLLRFRPDRVLCGRKGNLLWASFVVSRVLGVPLVFSTHTRIWSDADSWSKRLALAVDHWCMRRANFVLCHGPFLREQLLAVGVDADRIIEFDVSFDGFVEDRESEGQGEADATVLFSGRIEKEKGVFDLLEAFIEISREDERVRLVYAGDGSQLPALKNLVRKRGLQHRVTSLGQVPHARMGEVIQGCTVLVTPTRSEFPEGRCMAAMEGLVMGVPVIGPDVGPFPYLITHGRNGLLYRADSVEDLADKLRLALYDRDLRERMRRGAFETGRGLLKPPRSFGQAVAQAFAAAGNGAGRPSRQAAG